MLPPKLPGAWEIYAGDPASLTVDLTQGDPPVPRDLTGATFQAQWRRGPGYADAVTIDVDMTDAAAGRIVLRLTGDQTRALGANGMFDVQEVGASTVLRGTTTWTEDVTR